MSTITCPHCNKQLEITEALKHQIEEQVLSSMKDAHAKELQELKNQSVKEQEELKKQVAETIRKELEERSGLEFEDLKKQLQEKDKRVQELREQELKMREEKRKLEEREKELELSVSRRIDEEKKKIEEETYRKSTEEFRLKEQEKEKVISDLRKSLEDAQRKASQGSQQLQGEILELDIEDMLRRTFPQDLIEAVGKGVNGSDIKHIVRSQGGRECGTILWECKRTKAWSESWISKLKEDLRREKAHLSVIVSTVLPKEFQSGFGSSDNTVWVCNYNSLLPLAQILRKGLIDVKYEQFKATTKGNNAEHLYDYIMGHEFAQQVQAMMDVYHEMKKQLDDERNALQRQWKRREVQIERFSLSITGIYGTIEGKVAGKLPTIRGLDLLEDGLEE